MVTLQEKAASGWGCGKFLCATLPYLMVLLKTPNTYTMIVCVCKC